MASLSISGYRSSRGAVLIVALIILLVMTLVGISTMQGATLQERMASNNRQSSLARLAAESGLRAAEKWLVHDDNIGNVNSFADVKEKFKNVDGLYNAVDVDGMAGSLISVDLLDQDTWDAIGIDAPGLSDDVTARAPKYVIEYIGRISLRADAFDNRLSSIGVDTEEKIMDPLMYRITAIGWAPDSNIHSVLQSIFVIPVVETK